MGLLKLLKSQFFGLIVNLLQICTLPLWRVSKQLACRINVRLGYCISSQMVAAQEWWSGTECTLYTDPKSYPLYGKENAIVVLNLTYDIDFLCGWTICDRFGVLKNILIYFAQPFYDEELKLFKYVYDLFKAATLL
uniref:1-acylglycerol-3-phosphate O-acyltransferase n=1 Tax=Cyclopterus lumpus TaxID=8103 RepID=A0A8C3A823_CYCLU